MNPASLYELRRGKPRLGASSCGGQAVGGARTARPPVAAHVSPSTWLRTGPRTSPATGDQRRLTSAATVHFVLALMISAAVAKCDVPAHWAFQPVSVLDLPTVKNSRWARTDLDLFVLAKLEANRLRPSPRADKRTLIRRATFDLIGLPPTPGEVEAFLTDESPGAFERLVDRLLDSPHYGERWGRHWLDVARYADNKGYVFFEEKSYPWAWTYRDYVVRSLNEDKPFDQFVLEQLAADQLDLKGDARRLAALGFLTVGDHFSNNTHDILDDRIDVVTRGLLGLTVTCARCHDHKFDPVTMQDYYALYGVFRSCAEPMVPPPMAPPALNEAYEGFELELVAREQRLREFVDAKHRAIVHAARTRLAEYLMAVHAQRLQPPTENFMLIADKEDLNPAVIARWRSYLERAQPTDPVWRPWLEFATLAETNFVAGAALAQAALCAPNSQDQHDGAGGTPRPLTANTALNPRVMGAFSNSPPRSMNDVAQRYAALLRSVDELWQTALTNALQASRPPPTRLPHPADEALRLVLYGPDAPPDVPLQLDWGFLSLLPDRASQGEFQKLLTNLEQWLMHGPEAPARAMVLHDLPFPYEPRVFQRGNPNRPGSPVPRRFLAALDPAGRAFSQGSGRLELARAIVNPKNPLMARVFVNRVWAQHFGVGLVSTPSDFGLRSERPSHPELLDWMAGQFVRGGWKLKRLHRLILSSAVYQQSSMSNESGLSSSDEPGAGVEPKPPAGVSANSPTETDADNRLLWRFPRRRHDFETQRDALLAVAGKLDRKVGGPPVDLASARRTIYTFVNRLDVPPVLTTFDFPSPSASCPQRAQTTVAPQALYLMNNEMVAGCAEAVLRRDEVSAVATIEAKVARVYALLYGRQPTDTDRRRAQQFLGDAPSRPRWEQYVHALLLANEFVFVD